MVKFNNKLVKKVNVVKRMMDLRSITHHRVTQQTQIAEGRMETVMCQEYSSLEISHQKRSWKSCMATENNEKKC